jgi:hypothetical protein
MGAFPFQGVRSSGYTKDENFKVVYNGKEIHVTTYIALVDEDKNVLPVYDWYFALVIAGALQHKLPDRYIIQLQSSNSPNLKPDEEVQRPKRLDALCVLEQAGYKTVYQELVENKKINGKL